MEPLLMQKRLALLLMVIVLAAGHFSCANKSPTTLAQSNVSGYPLEIPRLGRVQAIASFDTEDQFFLAVWYQITRQEAVPITDDFLVIFERREDKYREVFRLDAKQTDGVWQHLVPFSAPKLPGVAIVALNGDRVDGATTMILSGGDKFQVVYQGRTSEFVDLNGDDTLEIFESSWPNGDGSPETTTVYVWNGAKYQTLLKTNWEERFARRTLLAVANFFRTRASQAHQQRGGK